MSKVTALTYPIVNWGDYISFIQEATGDSPTRCLDKHNLSLDNPFSFLFSLQSLKRPEADPWKDKLDLDLLNHCSLTFGIFTDFDTAEFILSKGIFLKASRILIGRSNSILILSGTMLNWKLTLPIYLREDSTKEARGIFASIYTIFKQTDLRNLWSDYCTVKIDDGSIILRLR